MNLTKKAACAAVVTGILFGVSAAPSNAEERKFGYSASATFVTDYLFRGISLSNEKPAFQPYLELTYGIAYLGFWGSNIGSQELADAGVNVYGPWEVDYYAGIRPTWGPVNFDIGVLWYTYGARANKIGYTKADVDYVEFKISASTALTKELTVVATAYATPDQNKAIPETGTIEGTATYTLPQVGVFVPALSAGIGYTTAGTNSTFTAGSGPWLGDDGYAYWNAGLKLTVEKLFFDFRYWDTSVSATSAYAGYEGLAGERFLFSAGITLP